MSLATLLLLWSLTVPEPSRQKLFEHNALEGAPAETAVVLPARIPPLRNNGWTEERR